jgi:hypothetical protein
VLEVLRRGGISHAEVRCLELEERLEDARNDMRALIEERDVLRGILAAGRDDA